MFTIDELIKATQGRFIQGPVTGHVKSICIDSRLVKEGQLFIAVKGDVFDGHDFIKDVVSKGVRVVLLHKPVAIEHPKVSVIMVRDTTRALGHLARFYRLRFKIPVIALTGSAGKTTTKEMIACVLGQKYRVLKNEGTQNNHIGVPLTLLKLKPSYQAVVLECGSNQPGDIPWLGDVARPDIVVFTNIGESHLEKLKSPQGVLKEKWTLTSWMSSRRTVIINADDPLLSVKARGLKRLRVVTYGMDKPCRFRARNVRIQQGHRLCFEVLGKTIELNTCGINNVYNGLAAYTCGRLMSVADVAIVRALKHFEFPKGRGQIVKLGVGWLINDTYNANPVSMRCAIDTLATLKAKGKKIMMAADMLELGTKAKDLHRDIGQAAAQAGIDVLITVGALSRHMAVQAHRTNKHMRVFACTDIESAQKHLARVLDNGDAVLVKGSRRMAMEKVVEFLLRSPGASSPNE